MINQSVYVKKNDTHKVDKPNRSSTNHVNKVNIHTSHSVPSRKKVTTQPKNDIQQDHESNDSPTKSVDLSTHSTTTHTEKSMNITGKNLTPGNATDTSGALQLIGQLNNVFGLIILLFMTIY